MFSRDRLNGSTMVAEVRSALWRSTDFSELRCVPKNVVGEQLPLTDLCSANGRNADRVAVEGAVGRFWWRTSTSCGKVLTMCWGPHGTTSSRGRFSCVSGRHL